MYMEDKSDLQTESSAGSIMEYNMTTILKWIFVGLLAGLTWLVAGYADEYFRPYKKIRTTIRTR
jgi:hypothetical protein